MALKFRKLRLPLVALFVLAFVLVCLPCCRLQAQVTGATVNGTVSDPQGNVVVGAKVTLTNTGQGAVRSVETNKSGDYSVPNVTPGSYQLQVASPGFRTEVHNGVNLTVGDVQSINIRLSVGAQTETIQVESVTSEVELGNSAMSAVVMGETARELPLNGRDWTQLAALEPGTVTVRSQPDASNASSRGNRGFGQQLSIAGARPQLNSYRIDGIIANDYANSTPGSTIGLSLGTDAILSRIEQQLGLLRNYGRRRHQRRDARRYEQRAWFGVRVCPQRFLRRRRVF